MLSFGLLVGLLFLGACEKNENKDFSNYLSGSLDDWSIKRLPEGCIINEYIGNQTEIVFPTAIDGLNVVGIGFVGGPIFSFYDEEKITSVDLRKMKYLKSIGNYAFNGLTNLSKLYLTNSIDSIGDYAFINCSNCEILTDLPVNLKYLGTRAFSSCPKITEIKIPGSVKNLPEGCFENCKGLSKVTFNEGLESIDQYCFFLGENIKELTFPSSLKVIGKGAFDNCISITEIEINEGCETLGDLSFRSCTSLSKVVLPKSLLKISTHSFSDCDLLTYLELKRDSIPLTTVASSSFSGTPQVGLTLTVTYPANATYPTEPVWENLPITWVPK